MSNYIKRFRVNYEIKAAFIRLIDEEGKMLGQFQVADAVKIAYEKGLDLIEVAPDANPPTCKIMDFGKYKYQMKKKAAESKKKQTVITVKEIQLRPNTDQHDVDTKIRQMERFLAEGDKCRVVVTFRGREVTHIELGRAVLDKIITALGGSCVIEQPPQIDGKKLSMLLGPSGKPGVAKPPQKAAATSASDKGTKSPAGVSLGDKMKTKTGAPGVVGVSMASESAQKEVKNED